MGTKFKEQIEKYETLLMEHKLIIERMETRLENLRNHKDADEPIVLSVMAQIEFYYLNLKVTVLMKEKRLEEMKAQLKYEEIQKEE